MTESHVVNRWINEACEQARIEQARKHLIQVLHHRFPAVLTPEVLGMVNAQPSLEVLRDWFDMALTAFSSDAFLAVLRR